MLQSIPDVTVIKLCVLCPMNDVCKGHEAVTESKKSEACCMHLQSL